MVAELSKTPLPVVGEARLPPLLEADIALLFVLAGLAIDFSIGWFHLVRIFFNQDRSELRVEV